MHVELLDELSGDESEFDENEQLGKDRIRQQKNNADLNLAKFFIGCSISFRTVESNLFKDFIKAVQECEEPYLPPCRQVLGSTFVQKLKKEIDDDRRTLLQGTSGVLMMDG